MNEEDIVVFIEKLNALRVNKGHFHARSDFTGTPGIGDIEFYWAESEAFSNLVLE